MPAPNPIVQHVLTKNLLRNFANSEGFIRVELKSSSKVRNRHINKEGYIPKFITENASEAEARWNEIESGMSNVYRHIKNRTLFQHPEEVELIKRFIALHTVRSSRVHRQVPDLIKGAVGDTRAWINSRTDLPESVKVEAAKAFEKDYKRQANGGDMLRRTLFQLLEEISTDFIKHNDIEIGIASERSFIIGDNPVVTFDNKKMEIDAPLKQTDVCFMPLTPSIVVALPSKKRGLQQFRDISSEGVDKLNALSRSAAYERIYLGPTLPER